jgi:hypothetical protein
VHVIGQNQCFCFFAPNSADGSFLSCVLVNVEDCAAVGRM